MLRQMPSEEGRARVEPVPAAEAAKVRVTPEELVRAMAAIEARREQEARERDGTIAIGDAVQELGLNATPEEILAAVQAQRVRQVQPVTRSGRPLLRRAVLTVAALTLGLFVVRSTVAVAVAPPSVATPASVSEAPPADPNPPSVSGDLDRDGRADLLMPLNTPNRYDFPPPPTPGGGSMTP